MEKVDFSEKAIVLAGEAKSLVVVDQETANRATQLILAGKEVIKKIKDYFAPLKKAADEAKKKLLDAEKAELQRVEPYIEKLQSSLTAWRLEQERKRREAEEVARRAELERKRLEEELLRKAEEARRLEEEKKRLEGEEAAKKAREELERKALEEIAAKEAEIIPPPPIPEKPKTEGLTLRENWTFEIVDESLIPREYLVPDLVKIRKVVQVMKDRANIPGIRVFNNPVVVKTR